MWTKILSLNFILPRIFKCFSDLILPPISELQTIFSLLHTYFFFLHCVALAAASSPLGVIGGALAGHGVATLVNTFLFAASNS